MAKHLQVVCCKQFRHKFAPDPGFFRVNIFFKYKLARPHLYYTYKLLLTTHIVFRDISEYRKAFCAPFFPFPQRQEVVQIVLKY